MADAVKTIKAERMPGVNGANRFELVGHVYYHPGGLHCAVPKIGEAYTIYPGYGIVPRPDLLTGSGPILDTADATGLGNG
jgi:hypothetical protein